MIGLIHRLLFDLIESNAGAETDREVKRCAGVPEEKTFRMDAAYEDEAWRGLLAATRKVLDFSPEQAEETLANSFYKDAIKRRPMWSHGPRNARDLLELQLAFTAGLPRGSGIDRMPGHQ